VSQRFTHERGSSYFALVLSFCDGCDIHIN